MMSSPDSESSDFPHHRHRGSSSGAGGGGGSGPHSALFVHRKIEDDIEHFVENFKQRSSALDRRPSSDSGDSSGWTSSVFSATDTPSTDSPDRESEALMTLPEEDVHGRNGIIAESRRIAQWALRQARYNSASRDACTCTYHPKLGDVMGEAKPQLKVTDVAELLQSRFVILTGGKAKNGAPLVTFPDRQGTPDVTDDEYAKVMTYLCSLVPLHEQEAGFVVIIDRRQDGWGSVKSILLKMSMFFPAHVQVVFLLQPRGFFQRAFADFRSKFVKEELEFKVVVCDGPEEMADYVDGSQLTKDLGGDLTFDPSEWTEQRSAVEKFAQNCQTMSASFSRAVTRLGDPELPNDVREVQAKVNCQQAERKELLDDFGSATTHGATLLRCIKGDSDVTPLVNLGHVLELERLLVQLDETKAQFDQFWAEHERKMLQGLHLRQFEDDFKLCQFSLGVRIEQLEGKMGELGSTLAQVEAMVAEFETMEEESQKDLDHAGRMRSRGEQLMMEDQYAVDSIRPKCVELQRMCEQYKELLRHRRQVLTKSHDLHDRLDRANRWCSQGVELLASQPLDRCQTVAGAQGALSEIDSYVKSSRDLKLSNPKEFRSIFEEIMTPESRGTVQQVLKRVDDVQSMCLKRQETLLKTVNPRSRPVQEVNPAPAMRSPSSAVRPLQDEADSSTETGHKTAVSEEAVKRSPVSSGKSVRLRPDMLPARVSVSHHDNSSSSGISSKASSIAASDVSSIDIHLTSDLTQRSSLSSASLSSFPEMDTLQAKRQHVMNELIETEEMYVKELDDILRVYYRSMEDRNMQHLIPPELIGKKHVLFGNLEEIFKFHQRDFLKDLKSCKDYPARVGRCFVNRKEEFQMYSIYCQNKPKSEALRMKVGDSNQFFKECQKQLGHKLPLGAFLLKPVQRITKYQLLLKEMLRFTGDEVELKQQLQEALDTMLAVLQYLNASMHQVRIVGFQENLLELGRLLMHGGFSVWMEHKRNMIKDIRFKPMQRHIFLYERGLLLCKKKEEAPDDPVYTFKNKLKLSQVGLTEKVKGDKRKFELWSRGREEVFIIQAPTMLVKDMWVKEIKRVLLNQFDQIKSHKKMYVTAEESCTPSQLSSDSSEYSLDNWKGGGSTTTSSTPTQSNNNHNHRHRSSGSTLPLGLEMISPISPPGSSVFAPQALPRAANLPSERVGREEFEEDGGGWSSGEFSDEEEMAQELSPSFEPSYRQQFVSLGDYQAVDSTELSLCEGEVVEVLRTGNNGWWYARHARTEAEGWVPTTYLEPVSPCQQSVNSSSGMNV